LIHHRDTENTEVAQRRIQFRLPDILPGSIKKETYDFRVWHGVTPSSKADQYLDYLNKTGIPDLRATEGNQGVYVLRRIEANRAHFMFLSLWESLYAIKRFTGPDFENARYYPEDDEYLLEREPTVDHYEVVTKP